MGTPRSDHWQVGESEVRVHRFINNGLGSHDQRTEFRRRVAYERATQNDAPMQTVERGQTPDEVQAALGRPDQIVSLGTKMIYVYKDLGKVTFLNGKVSDVQ
jgi:hypothetical protein